MESGLRHCQWHLVAEGCFCFVVLAQNKGLGTDMC